MQEVHSLLAGRQCALVTSLTFVSLPGGTVGIPSNGKFMVAISSNTSASFCVVARARLERAGQLTRLHAQLARRGHVRNEDASTLF